MKRNQTIDLLKLIFAIGVIAIHAQLFEEVNKPLNAIITMGLFRIGVPFFFITSGYFYYKKVISNQDTKTYLLRLVKLFVIFEGMEVLLYTPFSLSTIGNMGILRYCWNVISVGLGGAYWYISSTILSLLILTPLWKNKKIAPMLFVGLVLYLIAFTNDSYGAFFEGTWIQEIAKIHTSIWRWPQAGLSSSLCYLSLGAYLYEKQPKIKNIRPLLAASIIVLLIEAYLLQINGAYDGNCYFTLLVCAPLLFLYAQKYPININFNYLGKMSLYVYMLHPILLMALRFLIPFLNRSSLLLFVACTLVTVPLSYLLSRKLKTR